MFATGYLQSQKLDQRILIAPPELTKPQRNGTVAGNQVDFEWSPVLGTKSIDVTHYHCLWKSAERYDFNKCVVLSKDGSPLDEFLPPALGKQLSPIVCIIVVVILFLLALVLFIRNKRRASLFVFLLALLFAVICWLQHRPEPTSHRIKHLEPGESYSWKIVTETNDGLTTESETLRFEVKK